jgi:hypothetical protein
MSPQMHLTRLQPHLMRCRPRRMRPRQKRNNTSHIDIFGGEELISTFFPPRLFNFTQPVS